MRRERIDELTAHVGSQPYSVVVELLDEIKRMRPIVEAAKAWRENAYRHNRSWTVPDEYDSALVSAIDAALGKEQP